MVLEQLLTAHCFCRYVQKETILQHTSPDRESPVRLLHHGIKSLTFASIPTQTGTFPKRGEFNHVNPKL